MSTAAIRRRLDKLEGVIEAPPVDEVGERDAATLRTLIGAAVRWRDARAGTGDADMIQFLGGLLARAVAGALTDADSALFASLPVPEADAVELVRLVVDAEAKF